MSVRGTSRSRQRASASPRGSLLIDGRIKTEFKAAPMLGPIVRKPKLADLQGEPAQGSQMGAHIDERTNLRGRPAQKPDFLTSVSKPTQPLRDLKARAGAGTADAKNEKLYNSLRQHE
jgi:hypothetical protein